MLDQTQDQAPPLPGVPPFQIPVAFVTKQRYSELTGLPIGVIEAQVDRKHLPSKQIGKYRMVNLARLWMDALGEES